MMKTIPKEDHDLIRYSYFSRAMEGPEDIKHVNPNKLKTLWTKLGEKQKKLLVPEISERRNLDNYVSLVQKNPKAVNKMLNPLTGQINNSLVSAYLLMHPIKSLKEIVLGNLGQRQLTSEKARERIVEGIMKRRKTQ